MLNPSRKSTEPCTAGLTIHEATLATPLTVLQPEGYTIDDALSQMGTGTLQFLLLVILGVCYSTCSATAVLMLFLEPNVSCEWNLDKTRETLISVAVLLGMAFGSNLWGSFADVYGRKVAVLLSLLVEGMAGVMTAVVPNYWLLLTSRALVGIGAGGSCICFSMYSEFLPVEQRGSSLCWYQVFWALGSVTEALTAWLILPAHGWKLLAFLTAIPPLVLLPLIALLPESPRYLMSIGRNDRALCILQRVAHVNGSCLPDGRLKSSSTDCEARDTKGVNLCDQLASLFVRPLNRVTPPLWFLAFALGIGYFSVLILTATVHTEGMQTSCIGKAANLDDGAYSSILVDSAAEIPGVLLAVLTVERLGRVKSMVVSWFASWLSMTLLLSFPAVTTAFLFMARLFLTYATLFILVLTPEIYPSSCRCVGVGLVSSLARLGGMVAPFVARALYDSYGLRIVAGLCSGLFLSAAFVSFLLLPFETAGKELMDDVQQLQHAIPRLPSRETCSQEGNTLSTGGPPPLLSSVLCG